MSEKLGIIQKYESEISEIATKLKDLENGRIYEQTGARMDGSLATNVQQLRKMIKELLRKIDNQAPSINDELEEWFGK